MIFGFSPESPQCSRAGCAADATMSVIWRNPKIHGPERRKVWLACDEHATYLHDFLASRAFPVIVEQGIVDGSTTILPEVSA